LLLLGLLLLAGCRGNASSPEKVWGKRGVQDGDLSRPRAIAIDREDRLFLVDFTARIQSYSLEGDYLGVTFRTPDFRNGRPSGLGIDRDGNLMVCDSHYHAVRIYDFQGKLLRTLGGNAGHAEGEFGYISDAVQDADGFFYVSEFSLNDRITKLNADGSFVKSWGKLGLDPGEFNRARALALGPDGLLYVADACNHRVQVFDRDGNLVRLFGEAGTQPGQLSYPYDLSFSPDGLLYVCEYGNHRVQKFDPSGKSLGTWGIPGRKPGEFSSPWALCVDRKGRVHVVDTENHRVQRIRF
jgi:DNA-binding beta-propeller fold protein YncE